MPKKIKKPVKKYLEVLDKFGLQVNFDFSKKEKKIIKLLAAEGGKQVLDLTEIFDIKPEKAHRLVDDLVEKGALTEKEGLIELTPASIGYVHAKKQSKKSAKKFYRFLDTLSEDDLEEFLKLIANFKVDPNAGKKEEEAETQEEPKPVKRGRGRPRTRPETPARKTRRRRRRRAAPKKAPEAPKEEAPTPEVPVDAVPAIETSPEVAPAIEEPAAQEKVAAPAKKTPAKKKAPAKKKPAPKAEEKLPEPEVKAEEAPQEIITEEPAPVIEEAPKEENA